MIHSTRFKFPLKATLLLAVILSCAAPHVCFSQETTPPVQNKTVNGESQLKKETIEQKRQAVAESAELDEDTKAKVDGLYTSVLNKLTQIEELGKLATNIKLETEQIPKRIEEFKTGIKDFQNRKVKVPQDVTLAELEQRIAAKKAELTEAKNALAKSDSDLTARAERRKTIRAALLSSNDRLNELNQQLQAPAPEGEHPLHTEARKLDLEVSKKLIQSEVPALQSELAKYDAQEAADYLRNERDLRDNQVRFIEREIAAFEERLGRLRKEAAQQALDEAKRVADDANPFLKPLADLNKELAEKTIALNEPISTAKNQLQSATAVFENLKEQFRSTIERVDKIGLTGAVGAYLRRQKADLPDITKREQNIAERRVLIEDLQYQLFEYDDKRDNLVNMDLAINTAIRDAPESLNASERKDLKESAAELLENQKEQLDLLIRSLKTNLDVLFELDLIELQLIQETEAYQTYIDERVLWVRSNRPLYEWDLWRSTEFVFDSSDTWILNGSEWMQVGLHFQRDFINHSYAYAMIVVLIAFLLRVGSPLRKTLKNVSETAARGTCTLFAPTLRAVFITFALSLPLVFALGFIAWRLSVEDPMCPYCDALSMGLINSIWFILPADVLHRVCRRNGLADSHLDWSIGTRLALHRNIRWFMWTATPIIMGITTLVHSDADHGVDIVERLLVIALCLVTTIYLWRILPPMFLEHKKPILSGWFLTFKPVIRTIAVLFPMSIALLATIGFYYTALQVSIRVYVTIVFLMIVFLIQGLLKRFLLVLRRHVTIQQRKAALAEANATEQVSDAANPIKNVIAAQEKKTGFAEETEQTKRLLSTGMIVTVLIGLYTIWYDVAPALHVFDEWKLWSVTVTEAVEQTAPPIMTATTSTETEVAETPVTREVVKIVSVADLTVAILIGIVTFVCARNIPGLVEISLYQKLPLEASVRYAITSLTSYFIVLIGVLASFQAISVSWTTVQWLVTALTFGLAFGLQEIFANFVAGLILLFERPIRVGDIVTVDDVTGIVSRIRIRATTITNWDRKEYVIPNKEFVTGRMLNWTLSDKVNRIVIEVGVAYGSDTDKARTILLDICDKHPLIMDDPKTFVTFEGFGDNCLNFVVRTYLPDLDNRLEVVHELHTQIHQRFKAGGIEIAFPQRDLHLRSIDSGIKDLFKTEVTEAYK